MRKSEYSNICYGCRCDSCFFSVENRITDKETLIKMRESGIEWHACFSCDYCKHFDGDRSKRDHFTQVCDEYIIDDLHAERLRDQFKII